MDKPKSQFEAIDAALKSDPLEIDSIDLTFRELSRLEDVPSMKFILEFMKDCWCGNTRSRETRVRMGTMYIKRSENGALELKFLTRFTIDDEILEALKSIQHDYTGSLIETWNKERLEILREKYTSND